MHHDPGLAGAGGCARPGRCGQTGERAGRRQVRPRPDQVSRHCSTAALGWSAVIQVTPHSSPADQPPPSCSLPPRRLDCSGKLPRCAGWSAAAGPRDRFPPGQAGERWSPPPSPSCLHRRNKTNLINRTPGPFITRSSGQATRLTPGSRPLISRQNSSLEWKFIV